MNSNSEVDVLVLNAHPDDSEMAMGGTLLLLAATGKKILNVSLTKGQGGTYGTIQDREEEFKNAQKFIGSEAELWDYHDSRLENSLEVVEKVAKLIRIRKPKIVFAPYLRNDKANFSGMANKDHSVAGKIASEAMKLARLKNAFQDSDPHVISKLYFYMIPLGVSPQIVVDVSSVIEKLKDLIKCYKTQLMIPHILDRLIAYRISYGSEARLEYAEAFLSEMPLNVDASGLFKL